MKKSTRKVKTQLWQQPRFRGPALGALIAMVVAGGLYLVSVSHGASGVLSVQPTATSAIMGSTFNVTVMLNTGTDSVNAVEADLTYPTDKLTYAGYDNTGSAFGLDAASPAAGSNTGTLQFARSTSGGAAAVSSTTAKVVTVSFTAIAPGSAAIGVATSSLALRASDSTNILTARNGGTATVTDATAPSVPAGLNKTASTVTSASFDWTAATDNVGVTSYNIYRGGTQIGSSATTSYTDASLTPNTAYSYTIAAVDAAGNISAKSAALSISTLADTTAPSVPTSLTAGTRTFTTIPLSWAAASDNVGVTAYKIYRGATQVGSVSGTTFTDTGLAPGTSYTYKVAAADAVGNLSAQSSALTTSTVADTSAPSAPTGLHAGAQAGGTVALTWNGSTDNVQVTGYKIYRDGTQVGTSAAVTFASPVPATAGTYNFTVASYDASGNTSAQSTAVSVSAFGPADINHDGKINIYDLSAAIGLGTSNAAADVNGDGTVNITDLSRLLSAWTG